MPRYMLIFLVFSVLFTYIGYKLYGTRNLEFQSASLQQVTSSDKDEFAREEQMVEEAKPAHPELPPDKIPKSLFSVGREPIADEFEARQLRAQEDAERFRLERESILAGMEQQTLGEAIEAARKIYPEMCFTLRPGLPSIGIGSLAETQQTLLEDPRFARIAAAAMHGDAYEKARLREDIHNVLMETLSQQRKYLDGQTYDPDKLELSGGSAIYPMVLAQLDEDGTSLPILMEWYLVEEEQAVRAVEGVMALGTVPPHASSNAQTMAGTPQMLLIASAAQVIVERIDARDSHDSLPPAEWEFEGGRWGIDVVEQAEGFPLLPQQDFLSAAALFEDMDQRTQGLFEQ